MTSVIQYATSYEKNRAETIRNKDMFPKGILKIISQAESKGFRVIYVYGNKEVGILMPSKHLLYWDFNPRSLDSLQYRKKNELKDASTYAGLVAQSLFDKRWRRH